MPFCTSCSFQKFQSQFREIFSSAYHAAHLSLAVFSADSRFCYFCELLIAVLSCFRINSGCAAANRYVRLSEFIFYLSCFVSQF